MPKLTPPPFYAPPARWNEKAKTSEFAPEWLDYFTKQADFLGNALNFASNDGGATLTYTDATTVTLVPTAGGRIPVYSNGSISLIEVPAGVTLSNSGLAVSTLYYVYAFYTGTRVVLEASTTGHANASGLEVKSDDIARTLVGMVRTNGSAQFADTNSFRGVASWFNTRARSINAATATDVTINSIYPLVTANYSNLFATDVVVLSWGQAALFNASGVALITSLGGAGACDTRIWMSVANVVFGLQGYNLSTAPNYLPVSASACAELAEGAHVLNIKIACYNNTNTSASSTYLASYCGFGGMVFI